MQTRFILVQPLPVPTSSPQATHLRFSTLFVKILFTKSKPHRDNPSLVFKNPYNLRDPRSLNQSL
ncbi:hypothetical protein GmHk_09G025179 [Glycine max]|nr:hypothetical protein GmHk_09G025179 [Glycine max]